MSIHQFPGRPAEARATAEDTEYSNDQEDGEEEPGRVRRATQELELKFLGPEGGGAGGLVSWV